MSAVRNASESAYVRHERSGLNRLEIASYTDYLHLLQHGSFEKLTMLDLYSLSGLKREEMRNLLYTTYQDPKHGARMWVNRRISKVDEAKLLLRINAVYAESTKFLRRSLLLNVPTEYAQKMFKSVDDFLDFMERNTGRTKEHGYWPVIRCALLKTMVAVHDVLDNPHLSGLENKLKHVFGLVERMDKIRAVNQDDDATSKEYIFHTSLKAEKNPHVTLDGRGKQLENVLRKSIGDRAYSSVNLIKDIIAIRFEMHGFSSPEMRVEFMRDIKQAIFWDGLCSFDQIGTIFNPEMVEEICGIPGVSHRGQRPKARTNNGWEAAKFVGIIMYKGTSISVEVQVVEADNKNESGYQNHSILDMKKVLTDVCRLLGSLTVGNIKVAIQEIGMLSGLTEQVILNHLIYEQSPNADSAYLIPMVMKTGAIRFVTKDFVAPALMSFYTGYPQPLPLEEFDTQSFHAAYNACPIPDFRFLQSKNPNPKIVSRQSKHH